MASFGELLGGAIASRGSVCLGIDPHSWLLQEWDLADSAAGAREFGLRCVEAATGAIGIIKPQVAFFERFGAAGYAALEEVLAAGRAAGLVVIADCKRGDVGSTVAAYGAAWLTPGSPLEADAMTVSAYQGLGSLSDVLSLADKHGKGVFVLAATSNPEARDTQLAVRSSGDLAGRTVAAGIVSEAQRINTSRSFAGESSLGSVGVVIGATVALSSFGITLDDLARTPVLAPGFGEQGADLAELTGLFGRASRQVVANVGRSALRAGPTGLRGELQRQARIAAEAITS